MNKKTYMAPNTIIVKTVVKCHFLAGSYMNVNNDEVYDDTKHGAIRSREGFWEDEE